MRISRLRVRMLSALGGAECPQHDRLEARQRDHGDGDVDFDLCIRRKIGRYTCYVDYSRCYSRRYLGQSLDLCPSWKTHRPIQVDSFCHYGPPALAGQRVNSPHVTEPAGDRFR